MADPQIKNGYTRIANELLEAICRLNISGNEMRILLYIIRRTYGFNKTYAELSISELAEGIGTPKDNISRTLKKLRKAKIIDHRPNKGITPQTVSINKNYEEWSVESCSDLLLSKKTTVVKNDNSSVVKIDDSSIVKNDYSSIVKIDNHTYKENKKENKERDKERTPHGEFGNVFLSDDEINKLNQDYGESNVREYIKRVDEWVQSTGRTRSDYYATLRHWLDQDGVKKSDFDASLYDWAINNF